jgi:DNA ligase (NAD+)
MRVNSPCAAPACPSRAGASEFGPRQELAALLEQHGATVASAVSRNTSALLAGDKPGGSKFSKAQQLGVRVVPVAEFLREHGLRK